MEEKKCLSTSVTLMYTHRYQRAGAYATKRILYGALLAETINIYHQ